MKIVRNKHPIPRIWQRHRAGKLIEREWDIPIGSLRAKLLLFKNRTGLRQFWKAMRGDDFDLGAKCDGAVTSLHLDICEIQPGKKAAWRRTVDPRYFCVIGMHRRALRWEVVAHEAVHAAFAYLARVRRTPWETRAADLDEEHLAYPVGYLTSRMVHRLAEEWR